MVDTLWSFPFVFFGGRSDPIKRLPSEKFGGFQTNPLFLYRKPGRNSKYRFSEVFGRHVPRFCMFEKIDWIQEVETPVTVVVELETLDQVRLHSKGLRDCSKFREWALEAQYLGTLGLDVFFCCGGNVKG